MVNIGDQLFQEKMLQYPCMFNMEQSVIIDNTDLNAKLKTVLEEDGFQTDIRRLNYLTWISFQLETNDHLHTSSLDWNRKAITLSPEHDMVSLANKTYIYKSLGDEVQVNNCLRDLDEKAAENHPSLLAEGKAQQAYCYARIGGEENQNLAITLYRQALETKADDNWSFGLGLACMRTIHPSMKSHNFDLNTKERVKIGARELFLVAYGSPDMATRAQSFMNLALLRSYVRRIPRTFFNDELTEIFQNSSIENLVDKALGLCQNDYKVYVECGRAIADNNREKAIQLLNKSNQIKKNSKAFHQLGFFAKQQYEKLSLWLEALSLSHYGDKIIVKGIQKLFRNSNELKIVFSKSFEQNKSNDVLIIAQDNNDVVDKVHKILRDCFVLKTKVYIDNPQNERLEDVSDVHVVILILPTAAQSDMITSVVESTDLSSRTQKIKVLASDDGHQQPQLTQMLKYMAVDSILDNIEIQNINALLLQDQQRCIQLLKFFNFLIEK